jgi:hypothetical protein
VTAEPEESELVRAARLMKVAAIVKKPWKPIELRELVAKVVGKRP